VETNWREIKKRRIVGIREREIKDITSLLFNLEPRMFSLLSKKSSARFRSTRKSIRRTRITLRFITPNIRMSLETGRVMSAFKSELSSQIKRGIRQRQMKITRLINRFFFSLWALVSRGFPESWNSNCSFMF